MSWGEEKDGVWQEEQVKSHIQEKNTSVRAERLGEVRGTSQITHSGEEYISASRTIG